MLLPLDFVILKFISIKYYICDNIDKGGIIILYRCAEDLNETAFLELLGEVNYEFNGYWFTIGGGFQDPPMDRSIPEYLILIRRKEMKYNEYDINNDICRISLYKPEYIDSEYDLEKFILSKDEIYKMIEVLNTPHYDEWKKIHHKRLWDYIKDQYLDLDKSEPFIDPNAEIPDYTKLPIRKEKI